MTLREDTEDKDGSADVNHYSRKLVEGLGNHTRVREENRTRGYEMLQVSGGSGVGPEGKAWDWGNRALK